MAARRYEISLRASEGSERVKCFLTREEKFRLSKRANFLSMAKGDSAMLLTQGAILVDVAW